MNEYDVCSWYISNYLMNYWREKEKKQITWLFPHHEKRENWITVFAVVPIFISLSQTQNCSSFSHVIHWVLGLHLIPSRWPRFLTFFLPTKEIKVAAVSFLKTRGNWILLNTRRYKKKGENWGWWRREENDRPSSIIVHGSKKWKPLTTALPNNCNHHHHHQWGIEQQQQQLNEWIKEQQHHAEKRSRSISISRSSNYAMRWRVCVCIKYPLAHSKWGLLHHL